MTQLKLEGLKARSSQLSSGFVVYRLRAVLDSEHQNAVRAALNEFGALDALQEDGATYEPQSRYLAGNCELPEASRLVTFQRTLTDAAERFGIEEAHFFELATEMRARDEDDEEDEELWKAGPPPMLKSTPFPLQGLDAVEDVAEDETFEDLAVAVKLTSAEPGTHTVLDMFHTMWTAAYIDRDADHMDFRGIAVPFDAARRTGILGIDNAESLPVALPDLVYHLAWVLAQLHSVIPVAFARLNPWCPPASERFLLAGNPILEQYLRNGQEAAVAITGDASVFDANERAAMCVEVGRTFDPSSADDREVALGWFDRALAIEPRCESARDSKITVLVYRRRLADALAVAPSDLNTTAFVLQQWSEIAPEAIASASDLITTPILDAMGGEAVAALVPVVAEHAPALLDRLLAALPMKDDLAGHLANAVSESSDDVKLAVWLRILDLPLAASGPHRTNHLMMLNNACVTTHARKQYELSAQLADRAQPYLVDNPFLPHSCACSYVAVGRLDDAIAQVVKGVELNYDHIERMEADTDLDPIRTRPEFAAVFAKWRARTALSEPVQWADSDSFEAMVLEHDKPVLVDFTASWCPPCKALAPILDKLAATSAGEFRVVKVDVDKSEDIAAQFEISSMPTLLMFRGGEETARRSGLTNLATLQRFVAGTE